MPRKWQQHWLPANDAEERDRLIHTLGNLTLLTHKLNSKVSNGRWKGEEGKCRALERHDVLFLNRDLLQAGANGWDDDQVRRRTSRLIERVLAIWPVPEGHQTNLHDQRSRQRSRITLGDLLSAERLTSGMSLYPRRKAFRHSVATLLADGRLQIGDRIYDTPTGAAAGIGIRSTNGWNAFLVSIDPRRSLGDVWREYRDEMAVDTDEGDGDDDDEE